jgi:hypothetical protein
MTRQEARARAEQFVYCDCTLGDILYHCQMAGIKTHTPKGKQKSRCELETALIDYYTEAYRED